MSAPLPHRKRVRHFDKPGHVHELTFSCYRRMPLLDRDTWRVLLSQSIDSGLRRSGFRLIAFVYMPEHVHLLVLPDEASARISRLLYAVKRPFSFRIKQKLERTGSPLLDRLTIRERLGKQSFRFWQEGGGYDRNLTSQETVEKAIDYLHLNPVRRKLCEKPSDWKWSSWRQYHRPNSPPDPDLPHVDTSGLAR